MTKQALWRLARVAAILGGAACVRAAFLATVPSRPTPVLQEMAAKAF